MKSGSLPAGIALLLIALAAGYSSVFRERASTPAPTPQSQASPASEIRTDPVEQAFRQRRSNLQVRVSGSVSRLLPDDRDGSRHQRFIIALDSGQTLLVAHNIDLAPRVAGLAVNDTVEIYGEYEWSAKGGVIHWTHHDPRGSHADGWIRHQGRLYQ